jgi:serine O-acetyltransferase
VLRQLVDDARELTVAISGDAAARNVARVALTNDSYWILATWRLRCAARRLHIPLLNHLLRRFHTVIYGIEIGNDVVLGRGVFFVHPIGIVVGGDARVGDRVRFMGSNTLGTARGDGHPTIEDDVVVGCGARVLGPVRVGARTILAANCVVLDDIPSDTVAAGIPATARKKSKEWVGRDR